jgi:hypothetical protein
MNKRRLDISNNVRKLHLLTHSCIIGHLYQLLGHYMLILQMYERKTSFRPRESRDLGNWGLYQGYAKSLNNDGIMKFRR